MLNKYSVWVWDKFVRFRKDLVTDPSEDRNKYADLKIGKEFRYRLVDNRPPKRHSALRN